MSKAVQEWLKLARSDLGLAQLLVENKLGFEIQACFHSQQAVEKLLKAYLTNHRKRFPKTHDIEQLLKLVHLIDQDLCLNLIFAEYLSNYAVSHRYPDAAKEELTPTKAKEAFDTALEVSKIILSKM